MVRCRAQHGQFLAGIDRRHSLAGGPQGLPNPFSSGHALLAGETLNLRQLAGSHDHLKTRVHFVSVSNSIP